MPIPSDTRANAQTQTGCTLALYAGEKRLPLDFLRALGLSDMSYLGAPAVRIPYFGPDGTEVAVRFRVGLGGADRFRWKAGTTPALYGLDQLRAARERGHVTLVEGESDAQTLWLHSVPAIGLPGASLWRDDRDAEHFDGLDRVYVVVEPDQGGEALVKRLAASRLRDAIHLVRIPAAKDLNALHVAGPERFADSWRAALAGAESLSAFLVREAKARRIALAQHAAALANEPDILERFVADVARAGVAGETRAAKLLYLTITSRLLERPVSAAVKGPSGGGKSYLVEQVARFFPATAYYALTAMSERALAYSEEPLAHRMLVLYEAAGMSGDFASYLVRSLLSEGRLRYATVEKTKDGLRPRVIEREGPTGLIVTSTQVHLHPENETRLMSIVISDSPAQTRAVLLRHAAGRSEPVDLGPWHALQDWLAAGPSETTIPFARALAEAIPPVAVRQRRDFPALLALIAAHALLHQATRELDGAGRIVATIADYIVVRELVADLLAEGIGASVSRTMRATVAAVAALATERGDEDVSVTKVAKALGIDTSAAHRRVRAALAGGYIRNLEDRPRRPARLVIGDALPDDLDLLPDPDRLHVCTCVGGDRVPPLPPAGELSDELAEAATWTA
ncbi:MAG: hypothetical protein HY691_16925 [Chloroflexi bacterium]|nr:hypothetical protein [Chloroflexota bacterium]